MPNLDAVVDAWPAWLALAFTMMLALNRLIEESSKFAGYLGKWAVKMNERAKIRHHIDLKAAEFGQAITDAVERARASWESDENEALRALDIRLTAVGGITEDQQRDIDTLRLKQRVQTAYNEYESEWHSRLGRAFARALSNCLPITDVPKHLDFWEFEVKFAQGGDWRSWGFVE